MPARMILVIGNDPNKVEVNDLGDVIYYKQQKIYSNAQYVRSNDLKRAEKAGRITILQRYGDIDGEVDLPITSTAPRRQVQDTSKLDLVLERMTALESSLRESSGPKTDQDVVDALLGRIGRLEERISSLSGSGASESLQESLRQLAEKVESSTKDTAILDRLESILDRAGDGQESGSKEPTRPEDVYVPNVSVEDANTHIKLDVRAVEGSTSDLDASLAALKKLKDNK